MECLCEKNFFAKSFYVEKVLQRWYFLGMWFDNPSQSALVLHLHSRCNDLSKANRRPTPFTPEALNQTLTFFTAAACKSLGVKVDISATALA
jgi:hypothetical protein